MKKVILASVLAVAALSTMNAQAVTQSICNGAAGSGAIPSFDSSAGTKFIRTSFNPKCSANVQLIGDDGITYYRVGAVSTKGKSAFGGSTAGGAVSSAACASTTICTSADAVTQSTSAASS